jgi:hypothetical protein
MTNEADDSQKRRGADRLPLTAEVRLRRSGGQGFRVRVFDASPSGCKIEFVERPALGDRVWVKFGGLEALEATVRWLDGSYGGVEFARPVYGPVFDRIAR